MTRIVAVIVLLVWQLLAGHADAGVWSIHCVNKSCEASQGALKVYWMAQGNTYSGKLTGVSGLPISIDDYRAVEKRIEAAIERSTTRRRATDSAVRVDTPEGIGGPSAGTSGHKENLFARRQTMSQGKTMGRRVNVDYTLAFIEWLGDTRGKHYKDIRRYWVAAELALDAYKGGYIEELIESFFIARNVEAIADVAVDTPIDDDNRTIILTKYIGLTRYYFVDDKTRYSSAIRDVYDLATNPTHAKRITERYYADIESLKLMLQPGATALKLYKKRPDLAFAKWLADNQEFHGFESRINEMPLADRYLAAISYAQLNSFLLEVENERAKKGETVSSPSDSTKAFADKIARFKAAIENRDESVKIVTVKGDSIPVAPIAVGAGVILLVGAVLLFKRKKDKETMRQGDSETERQGDRETERHGDSETGRRGDGETVRPGDSETGR